MNFLLLFLGGPYLYGKPLIFPVKVDGIFFFYDEHISFPSTCSTYTWPWTPGSLTRNPSAFFDNWSHGVDSLLLSPAKKAPKISHFLCCRATHSTTWVTWGFFWGTERPLLLPAERGADRKHFNRATAAAGGRRWVTARLETSHPEFSLWGAERPSGQPRNARRIQRIALCGSRLLKWVSGTGSRTMRAIPKWWLDNKTSLLIKLRRIHRRLPVQFRIQAVVLCGPQYKFYDIFWGKSRREKKH